MPIQYTKDGPVARIVLDNPPVNVFTPQLHKDFLAILKEFIADDTVHVAVWTGAGDRSFCAGDDIKTPRQERTVRQIVERDHEVDRLMARLVHEMPRILERAGGYETHIGA